MVRDPNGEYTVTVICKMRRNSAMMEAFAEVVMTHELPSALLDGIQDLVLSYTVQKMMQDGTAHVEIMPNE